MISVAIPTIAGREDHFKRCVAAYKSRTQQELQLVVVRDKPTVGIAWNEAIPKMTGDYLHFTADDLEPLEGWDTAATAVCDRGAIPAPGSITRPDGTVDRSLEDGQPVSGYGTDIDTIPFCTREQLDVIGPFLDIHYFGDSFFSHRAVINGIPIVGCAAFAFVHHWAQVGRGAGMSETDRMRHDEEVYNAAIGR